MWDRNIFERFIRYIYICVYIWKKSTGNACACRTLKQTNTIACFANAIAHALFYKSAYNFYLEIFWNFTFYFQRHSVAFEQVNVNEPLIVTVCPITFVYATDKKPKIHIHWIRTIGILNFLPLEVDSVSVHSSGMLILFVSLFLCVITHYSISFFIMPLLSLHIQFMMYLHCSFLEWSTSTQFEGWINEIENRSVDSTFYVPGWNLTAAGITSYGKLF